MIRRGEVYWADSGEPAGSAPAFRRPVVVMSSDEYNGSRIGTVIVVALTSNTALGAMPGNVFRPGSATGLAKDLVANVTAIATVDRWTLARHASGVVPAHLVDALDAGLRRVLAL